MFILECSQGCYGRTDGSVTISLRNFVGEGMKRTKRQTMVNKTLHKKTKDWATQTPLKKRV